MLERSGCCVRDAESCVCNDVLFMLSYNGGPGIH